MEECSVIPKKECATVPGTEYNNITEDVCEDKPKEDCHDPINKPCNTFYIDNCRTVSRDVCREVPEDVCKDVLREKCVDVPSEVCKYVTMAPLLTNPSMAIYTSNYKEDHGWLMEKHDVAGEVLDEKDELRKYVAKSAELSGKMQLALLFWTCLSVPPATR